MAKYLLATRPPEDKRYRTRYVVELFDGDKLIARATVDPTKPVEIRREFTRPHGISTVDVQLVCEIPDGESTQRRDLGVQPSTAPQPPLSVTIRSRCDPKHQATVQVVETVADVLPILRNTDDLPPDALVLWESKNRLCCLDIDTDTPLPPHIARYVATAIQPRPIWWHLSRSGGLHLYYVEASGFAADELAAVAALWIGQYDTSLACELKRDTRHPGQHGAEVIEQTNTADLAPVTAWLRGTTEVDASSWLDAQGMAAGLRYDHTLCVIDPRPTSGDTPVLVGDEGLYCQVCASRGLTRGSKTPGFTPYAHLIGGGTASKIRRCVEHCVHWEQASVVIDNAVGLRGEIARLCYAALLRLWHGSDDQRIPRVFATGEGLIRRPGYWDFFGSVLKLSHGRNLLANLPAVQDCDGKTIPARVDIACQAAGLHLIGYDDIDVVRGMRIYGHVLPYPPNRIVTVRWFGDPGHQPRYVPADHRDIDGAWAVLESLLPGVDRQYLKLLILARGFSEAATGMPPLIYVVGATGSGKSQTVHLAASICGDVNTETPWAPDNQRFRQGIQFAAQEGGFCTINEIGKSARRAKMQMDSALESVLTLTPESTSHQLYVGPVKFGRAPVVVFTETKLDDALERSDQLGRRMVLVKLPTAVGWDGRISPKDFRTHSDASTAAANAILSEVIDEFFIEPSTFFDCAKRLGLLTIREEHEAETNKNALHRMFFDAYCDAKPMKTPSGEPYRRINRSDAENPTNILASTYLQICGHDDFQIGERLAELTWTKVLGVPSKPPIEVKIKQIQGAASAVMVLFRRRMKTDLGKGWGYDRESLLCGHRDTLDSECGS